MERKARYAHQIDPSWTGSKGTERVVHIVAPPDVNVQRELIQNLDWHAVPSAALVPPARVSNCWICVTTHCNTTLESW